MFLSLAACCKLHPYWVSGHAHIWAEEVSTATNTIILAIIQLNEISPTHASTVNLGTVGLLL